VRISLAIATALSCSLAACAAEPDPTGPVSDGSDAVTLRVATPDHLAGSYGDAAGRRIDFDSVRDGDLFSLDVRTADHVLIHAETVGDTYRFSYLDGRAVLTVERAWIAEVMAEEDGGPASQRELDWDGDPAVLDEMLSIPEVAALPWLSRTLGSMGFTGADYPASLALHKVARQSADALNIELPPIETAGAQDRCSRPTANECYGMCGPGCSCWSWVCGDCCYHGGCAKHDSWCRQGQWYYCYNISAVIALFGC
jgi:hypothetical protein